MAGIVFFPSDLPICSANDERSPLRSEGIDIVFVPLEPLTDFR
ncbi:MAG TPA: hypothetical protein VFO58_05395 [Vicinamibacterales bacterium]|nr:hypothetical protein [Vicinamibacterales bacterium]